MGTSKRKLSSEIKKMLKNKSLTNLNETAPEISKKILSEKILNEKFDKSDIIDNSIRIIHRQFLSLQSSGFKGKSKEELLLDSITQQEFLEMILDLIENDTTINSKILEKSLKIVMCKFFEIDEFEIYEFAQVLFYEIVYQILLGELNDNIKDIYDELNYELIQKMVKNMTDRIMNNNVYDKVNEFIDRKISLRKVLNEISIQTTNASFGEF
ncbi:hypothetical protein [Paenibacillus sp. 276b]|uniref:hypothetical protein n=1 Tax=Paenibacillus sp. 276b TaxID=1566277 RepID=UPI000895213C|nr:hypothetical protein [Paenibacillus sp. 276b]SEB20899.1 hypothetical protein SAMN03159332_4468 [Paenibacillus sp. 276b]